MQCATATARANSSSNGSYASEAICDTQIVALRNLEEQKTTIHVEFAELLLAFFFYDFIIPKWF